MNSHRVLTEIETKQISGGHPDGSLFLFLLALPHTLIGIPEFYNYVAERYYHGCQNVEPDDHFTQLFCKKKLNNDSPSAQHDNCNHHSSSL